MERFRATNNDRFYGTGNELQAQGSTHHEPSGQNHLPHQPLQNQTPQRLAPLKPIEPSVPATYQQNLPNQQLSHYAPQQADDLPLAFQRFHQEHAEQEAYERQQMEELAYYTAQNQRGNMDISFWRLVGFQVKFVLAACVSLGLIGLLVGTVYFGSDKAMAALPDILDHLEPFFTAGQ